jgi:hypothetical protein
MESGGGAEMLAQPASPPKRVIPYSLEVSDEKLRYLLTNQSVNDKSGFVFSLGFAPDRPHELRAAIRQSCIGQLASPGKENPEGWNFVLEGFLEGSRKGSNVRFVLSFRNDGGVHLVTLYPGTTAGGNDTEDT